MEKSQELKDLIERIERLEEEKRDVQSDIKQVYEEGQNKGYNKKVLKSIIKIRRMDPDIASQYNSDYQYYFDLLNEG